MAQDGMTWRTSERVGGRAAGLLFAAIVILSGAVQGRGEAAETPYPKMAPLPQYLMARDAEVAMARSAAPEAISRDAEVLVLTEHGYQQAAPGTNGFVCMVERSWTAGIDDPEFWSPKLRGPICFNPAAARTYLPLTIQKTKWVLAGQSKAQMFESVAAALDRKDLPPIEAGSMCYMLSRQGHLNDHAGPWRPHLMFFTTPTDPATWGAGAKGSPVMAFQDKEDRMTVFLIPVGKWSDGSDAPGMEETGK